MLVNTSLLADSINEFENTQFSIYKADIDGQSLNSSCFVVESILTRYPPKMIVLEAEDSDIKHEKGKETKYGYLF